MNCVILTGHDPQGAQRPLAALFWFDDGRRSDDSRPHWADKHVDLDRLEELERRHQERIPPTPAQPDWTVKKMDASTLGRLERASKLEKMTSFDKPPPDWADKRKSIGELAWWRAC